MTIAEILYRYRSWLFTGVSFLLAYLTTAAPQAAFLLILLLVVLLAYGPILRNHSNWIVLIVMLVVSLTAGQTIAYWRLAVRTISVSPSQGILAALLLSLIHSALAVCIVLFSQFASRLMRWGSDLIIFPPIWVTAWYGLSFWPIGRLFQWTAALGIPGYGWLSPVLGPSGSDWITANWAVVLYHFASEWYMGSTQDSGLKFHITEPKNRIARRYAQSLTVFITVLSLPTLLPTSLRLANEQLATFSMDNTPLRVGCVLPLPQRYGKHTLNLEDYIAETQRLTSSASLLLWPEGAVSFHNESEKDEAFNVIRSRVKGSYVGVAFDEAYQNPDDPSGRSNLWRNGLAVISQWSPDPHFVYYKTHLVPIVESFPLTASPSPPTIEAIHLRKPSYMNKTEWGPPPKFTREITLTSGICLDLAFPTLFGNLDRRPSIILSPANTWQASVGWKMWEEAVARATEIGSPILWCDGGQEGFSGIGGGIRREPFQRGSGSWVRSIAVQTDSTRTIYGRFDKIALVCNWSVILLLVLFELTCATRTSPPGFSLQTTVARRLFGRPATSESISKDSSRPERILLDSPEPDLPEDISEEDYYWISSREVAHDLTASPFAAQTHLPRRPFFDQFSSFARRALSSYKARSETLRPPLFTPLATSTSSASGPDFISGSSVRTQSLPSLSEWDQTPSDSPSQKEFWHPPTVLSFLASSHSASQSHPPTDLQNKLSPSYVSLPAPPLSKDPSPSHSSGSTSSFVRHGDSFALLERPEPQVSLRRVSIGKTATPLSTSIKSSRPSPSKPQTPSHLSYISSSHSSKQQRRSFPHNRTMDYTGKRMDVVDAGGEIDYSSFNWFQDAPIRPQPATVQQSNYVPLPGVVDQNDNFTFALSAAPNVLYARFKQYGELGVLAWCSEFSEMIDHLKQLGFEGNMFVNTRAQALRTCEDILKLKLEIKMQIIVMYLSSQVARLRKFLDGDRQFDDYPPVDFPVETRAYT